MQTAPKRGAVAKLSLEGQHQQTRNSPSDRAAQAPKATVAEIELSHCCRLRIALVEWRGARKLELRIATAQIPNVFVPTSDGFSLPIEKLAELIKALQKANAAASSRQGGAE